uniref:RNA1 polyprotein n=2 Tax=Cherry leaf roll virus TaxID=12615 RepID=A0A8F8N1R1_9SECO|nr:polyprotein 1 [Cherry leaf roll virus]
MVRPIVFSNGESVLPKALISEAKMVAAFLKSTRNPAGFWVTFLAQGTSLTPSQVALCAINGLVSRQTVEIHSHGPSAEVFWSALQARLRSFLRAHRQRVTSLLALCCEAYEARDLCRYQRQRAAYLARGAACRAKALRKKKTALRKERAAQLAQRQLEGERRAAARQAKLARKGQQVLRRRLAALFSPPLPFPTSEWAWEFLPSSPLPAFRDFFTSPLLEVEAPWSPPVGPVGFNKSTPQALYCAVRARLSTFSKSTGSLFPMVSFDRLVPGHLMMFQLMHRLVAAYSACPVLSLIEDGLNSLMNGRHYLYVFKEMMDSASQVVHKLTGSSHSAMTVQAGFGISNFFRGIGTSLATGFGDGLVSKALDTKDVIVDGINWVADKTVGAFVRALRDQFSDTVGKYLNVLSEYKAQIENFWAWAIRWSRNLMDKVDVSLRALQGSAFFAAALVILGGLVFLVENLLPTGMTGLPVGSLSSLFIGGALLFWCGKELFQSDKIMNIRLAIIAMAERMFAKPKSKPSPTGMGLQGGLSDIFGVPLSVMESIGSGLCGSALSSMTYVGKFGQAMDNIRKGVMCMRQFLGWMLEQLAELYDNVSGRKVAFFRELATLAQVDVEKWIVDVQEFLLVAEVAPEGDRVILDTVLLLLQKGQTIQRLLCQTKQGTSFNYGRLVATLVKSLDDVYTKYSKAGRRVMYRFVPFWAYFFGKARTGKTIFANNFKNTMVQYLGTTSENIFYKNARDQFWPKYRQQAIVIVDDLSSVENPPSLESEFIQLMSTMPYGLNMAAVDEKGSEFNSKMVITTSNKFDAPSHAKIHDLDAYRLRRHACVEVRRVPDAIFDAKNPYLSSEARFVNNCDQAPEGEWMAMEQMQEELIARYQKHHEAQADEYNFWKRNARSTHDVFDILEEKIREEGFWLSSAEFCMPDKEAQGIRATDRFIGIDGKIIKYDPLNFVGEYYKGSHLAKSAQDLENMALARYHEFADLMSAWSVNGVVKQFMEQLLTGPTHIDSIDLLGKEALPSHREFFDSLTLPKRAVLRLIQKKVDAIKAGPAFEFVPEKGFTLAKVLKEGYEYVYNNGGKIFLIFAAVVILWFLCGTAMHLVRQIFCGGVGAGSAGAMARMSVQSTIPSGSDVNSFASRNLRRVYRPTRLGLQSAMNPVETVSQAEQLMAWIETPEGNLISCCRFKSRALALTYHQARSIAPGSKIFISYMTAAGTPSVPIEHIWDPQETSQVPNLRRFNDTEVCVYTHPQLSPLPGPLESMFVEDMQAGATLYHIEGRVMKLVRDSHDYLPTDFVGAPEEIVPHVWSGVVHLNTHAVTIDNYTWGGDYKVNVPRSLVGTYPNSVEDCGGLLFSKIHGSYKVIGMHVAGERLADGSYLSAAALFPRPSLFISAQSGLRTLQIEAGKDTRGVSKVGFIKAEEIPRAPRKSSFVEVEPELKVPVPAGVPLKQIAILSSSDERLKGTQFEGYDPLRQATVKCEDPMFDLKSDVLEEVCRDIEETWFDCAPSLSLLSNEEMVNGNDEEIFLDAIVQTTSEGYPYVLERGPGEKGKERYLEQDPNLPEGKLRVRPGTSVHRDLLALETSIHTTIPILVGMEIPKDERLKESKILTPATRTFTVLPMPYNLLLRKFFGRFTAFLQGNRHRLPCAVGVNPYSNEWTRIFDGLAQMSPKALNGDYKSFDGKLNFQMYDAIARLLGRVHRDESTSQARYNLIMAMYARYSLCGSQVYEVRAGLPSGCAITVIMNSIFNEILIRYAYRVSVGPILRNRFNHFVKLVVYGDDNLIAVDPQLASGTFVGYEGGKMIVTDIFDGATIQKVLRDVNITITDGSDKSAKEWHFKPLESLDFLKRGFKRMADGRVLAPLDLSAIFSSLHVVRPEQGSTAAAVNINARVALRELWLHQDETLFNMVRSFFQRHNFVDLPNWRECRDFHQSQYTEWHPFKEYKFLEMPLPEQENREFMLAHATRNSVCVVANQTLVVGPGWTTLERENHFIVDLLGPTAGAGGDVRAIPIYGDGAGRIGTDTWVRSWRSSKFTVANLARQARADGKMVVFRDSAPFINGWSAAISFLVGCVGFEPNALLANYSRSGGQHRQIIERYFKAAQFEPRKVVQGVFA